MKKTIDRFTCLSAVLAALGCAALLGGVAVSAGSDSRIELRARAGIDGFEDIESSVSVLLAPTALVVNRVIIVDDNGDHDGWADDGETVSLRVEVSNKSGQDITGLTLRLLGGDPNIDCITRPFLFFGDIGQGETRFSDEAFEFIVGEVARSEIGKELTATFQVVFDANELPGLEVPQSITLDLDLNAEGGSAPTIFHEGFESGLGTFVPMPIDEDLNPPGDDPGNHQAGLQNAEGFRCQYSDPDVFCGFDCESPTCYPNPDNAPDAFWWYVTADRSFSGSRALHWGAALDTALGFTTPTAQLEAVRTDEPINLGWDRVCERDRELLCFSSSDCPGGPVQDCVPTTPMLSFKHQISLLDDRVMLGESNTAIDRAVVAVQVADADGDPVGNWIKIAPYVNLYDTVPNSDFVNCSFDPIDDGNTEDDVIDPSVPKRFLRGPSSTCAPERVFSNQGDTAIFGIDRIGDASDGPGLAGENGVGTWVEPIFDLSRFRGQRIRIRFLTSGLKVNSVTHWENAFMINPDPRDDGWFIDDVSVTDTLAEAAVVGPDLFDNSDLPGCGIGCQQLEAVLSVSPETVPVPGGLVTLDGSASQVDRCIDGVLQYRYWIDVNRDGQAHLNADVLLRDWNDNPRLVHAPSGSLGYLLEARCSTELECRDSTLLDLTVECSEELVDSDGDALFLESSPPGQRSIIFGSDRTTIYWPTSATIDAVRGDLDLLRTHRGFTDSLVHCFENDAFDTRELVDPDLPLPGEGFFYLLRAGHHCNSRPGGSWSTGSPQEQFGRDGDIESSASGCPD